MQFYIYQNSSCVEKKAQLQAISEDVKDETLDTACVQLFFDETADAYAPRALCKIVDADASASSGTRSSYYYVATDSVEIQTIEPRTYKHTLTLVQTTRKLSHYILPNMEIRKPRESVVSTFFTNQNTLNLPYYFNNAKTEGIWTWDGFTSNYIRATDNIFGVGYPSPYWGECVAVTEHQKFGSGIIKLYWDAMVCSADVDSGSHTATSAEAKFVRLARAIATPSWKNVYIVVYHCSNNVNRVLKDGDIKDRTDLAKISLDAIAWQGDYGYFILGENTLNLINSFDSGYIMCELVCEDTSSKPDKFWFKPTDASLRAEIPASCDRLFCDIEEYTENGIQSIWSRLSLELSSKQDTLYEVLQRILNRQQCKHNLSKNAPLFALPTSGDDYDVLTKTEAPEFSFTNLTVFEAVSQVLSTIDALPRFDASDDGTLTLGLDYFAQTGTNIPLATKFASYTSKITEQKRDNGILTNFQNAEIYSCFPCKPYDGTPIYARARVKSYGLPEYTDFALVVDKPIKFINHLWLKLLCTFNVIYDTGRTVSTTGRPLYATYAVSNVSIPLDMATFIFDEATYSSALDQGDYPNVNHNIRLQKNCLRFKQGSKEISIGEKGTTQYNVVYNTLWNCMQASADRMFGYYGQNFEYYYMAHYNKDLMTRNYPTENVFCDIYFSCEYGTDLDGRLEIKSPYPKEDGQFLSSTGSSSPDLGKLGLNMLGVALKSGEPTMTCSQMLTTWENRIKIGDVFTKNNEKWIATKASYTRLGEGAIKGAIEFTKNFNGLSKRIAIDQSKRLYNIDRAIASLCEANIFTYVYFEPRNLSSAGTIDFEPQSTPFDSSSIASMMMKAFTADKTQYSEPSYAYVTTISGGTQVAYRVYIPLAVYGAGNCLCFETKFSDPISAGVKMNVSDSGDTYWWLTDAVAKAYESKFYFGSDVKYTDAEGYAEYFQIQYLEPDKNEFPFSDDFPDCTQDFVGDYLGTIVNLAFDKQPNEIFGLNYEIAFLSRYVKDNNQVFFTQRFFDAWNDRKGLRTTQAIFYYSSSETYGYGDTKGKGWGVYVDVAYTADGTNNSGYLYFAPNALPTTTMTIALASFAICDQDGNILIACNCGGAGCYYRTIKGAYSILPTLCFFARQERL